MSEMALKLIRRAKAGRWKWLDLGNTGIVGAVPEEVGDLHDLEVLILSDNRGGVEGVHHYIRHEERSKNEIYSLNKSFPKNLRSLNVSGTDIRVIQLPSYLNQLRYLNASATLLDSEKENQLPSSIHVLDFSKTKIHDLQFLENLCSLEVLNLSKTQVGDISVIMGLPVLRSLDLSSTYIREICSFKGECSLEFLSAAQTNLENIDSITNCINLEVLNLNGTKIVDISPLNGLRKLKYLDLSFTGVANWETLETLPALESLFLTLTAIDDTQPIGALSKLTELDLRGTKISDIASLETCRRLEVLNIGQTAVLDLSPILSLKNLHKLSIARTKIDDIKILGQLSGLNDLDLSQTSIKNLDPLRKLKRMRQLNLGYSELGDLRPLMEVISSGVQVTFGGSKSSRNFIDIEGARISKPPAEILKKGNEAILSYWREQDRVGTQKAQEIKLFLLGNTTAGKSTLAHALIHNEYPPETTSTIGASLSKSWEAKDTKVNIWDFGGQEYFHATHRLLMNDDAIYVVVADAKFNQSGCHKTPIRYIDEAEPIEEDLEHFPHGHWLETIQNHALRSCTMMVWNKLDQENCPKYGLSDADKALFDQDIQEYSISLKSAFETKTPVWQNKWKVFTDDLQMRIEETLQGRQVIQYWPSVREAVEERSQRDIRIGWEEFEALCKADDPLRELGNIVIYLRDMCGAILYFPDHPILKNTVFINPNKINELIYAVLNLKVKKDGGRFDHKHAVAQVQTASKKLGGTALKMEEAETLTTELIEVMKQFDIIFETPNGSGEYIAPQYLKPEVPKEVTFALKNVAFKSGFGLQFKSFVPRHIVPRFIAQNGGFALDEGYWKTGILFSRRETALLVKVDYAVGRIFVDAAMTAGREWVLRELFGELRGLIDRDQSMQVVIADGAFVDYALLLEAEQMHASRVKNVDGQYLDISRFSLFLQKEVVSRPSIEISSSQTLHSIGTMDSQKNKTFAPTIGIITALPKEYALMKVLLDAPAEIPSQGGRGTNKTYTAGTIPGLNGNHSVVLGLLEDMGNNLAATNATAMLAEFQSIVTVVMVGIAGGVPHPEKPADHVRLGDIVRCDRNGVIQYDLVKETEEWVQHRHPPRAPSAYLLQAAGKMEANEIMGDRPYLKHLQKVLDTVAQAQRPPATSDRLASSDDPAVFLTHPDDPDRVEGTPRVFKGPIASANKLLKNPKLRDKLRDTFGVKAVEMEGSGIADATWNIGVDYFIVRGICDYCDSHKADAWQMYAAAVAAAYTRALLELVPGSEAVVVAPQVAPSMGDLGHSGFDSERAGKKVLISFAPEDDSFRNELVKHLSVMERNEEIQIWYRSKSLAGNEVSQVSVEMEKADVILLLLSNDYLSSKDISEKEMKVALGLRAAGKCKVTGIVLHPCDWASTDLGKITMMQRGVAVEEVKKHAAWAGVVGELKGMIGGGL